MTLEQLHAATGNQIGVHYEKQLDGTIAPVRMALANVALDEPAPKEAPAVPTGDPSELLKAEQARKAILEQQVSLTVQETLARARDLLQGGRPEIGEGSGTGPARFDQGQPGHRRGAADAIAQPDGTVADGHRPARRHHFAGQGRREREDRPRSRQAAGDGHEAGQRRAHARTDQRFHDPDVASPLRRRVSRSAGDDSGSGRRGAAGAAGDAGDLRRWVNGRRTCARCAN